MKDGMNNRKNINLVFVCSGAADVGEITDRAARQLRDKGLGAMSCLASIGARDSDSYSIRTLQTAFCSLTDVRKRVPAARLQRRDSVVSRILI